MFLQFSRNQLLCAAAAALIAGSWATRASAVLQGYEGFDYADTTSILGQTGGGGWSDAWTKTGNAAATEIATTPGLSYSSLPVAGNKVTLTGQQNNAGSSGNSSFVFRNFNTSFGADSTTTWLSFIGQRTGEKTGTHGSGGTASYQRIFGLSFFNDGTDSAANERWSVGELSSSTAAPDLDTWALNIFPTGEAVTSTTPVDQESFLLVRVDYGVGALSDNAYLWVNPDLSMGEPSIGSAHASLIGRNLEFDRLRLSAGGSQSTGAIAAASGLIDEIRVGTNFASVTGTSFVPGIGDVDGNGVIDINDYVIIRDNFQQIGTSRDEGDLNGDGVANLIDFRIWKDNRNAGASAGGGSGAPLNGGTVPEPSSLALFMLGMFLEMFGVRRRFARR